MKEWRWLTAGLSVAWVAVCVGTAENGPPAGSSDQLSWQHVPGRSITLLHGDEVLWRFNYDPAHLGYQGVDYVLFIRTCAERINHVHMKDAWWGHGDGTVGVFGGHTDFADPRRFWDFRSVGRGDVNFEEIMVALNDIAYEGPLSVEWEDARMDRFHGATESCAYVRNLDFPRNTGGLFDSAFDQENQ